jgi:hypothetical protein
MAVLTCRTADCPNAGIPIEIDLTWTDENGDTQDVDGAACGVCGETITDIAQDERETTA